MSQSSARLALLFAWACSQAYCGGEISAKNREIPRELIHLYHNNIYFRYSQGFGIYFTDPRNGYPGYSRNGMGAGMTIEAEVGSFIKDFMQIGISYLYMSGISESVFEDQGYSFYGDHDESLLYGYDDVFLSGGAIENPDCKFYLTFSIDNKYIVFRSSMGLRKESV